MFVKPHILWIHEPDWTQMLQCVVFAGGTVQAEGIQEYDSSMMNRHDIIMDLNQLGDLLLVAKYSRHTYLTQTFLHHE